MPSEGAVLLTVILPFLVVVLAACIALRSFELDEGYSLLLLDGVPRLHWPSGVFTRDQIAGWFQQHAGLERIPDDLRRFDVHPPVWFMLDWAWRSGFGPGLVAARCLSAMLTLVNLAIFWRIARLCDAPAALASALAFLCYVTVYTGATVRMYPLGLLFLLSGVFALLHMLRAAQSPRRSLVLAAIAGLCFGLASATHMLLVFSGMAMAAVAALVLIRARNLRAAAALIAVPLPFLAWSASYFLVQDRRNGQFPPFHVASTLFRVVRDIAAAIVGGTPLYVEGPLRLVIGAALTLLVLAVLALVAIVAFRGRRDPATCILAIGAFAMPCTLYALSAVFHREASEPRYMVYSVPFLALLLARAIRQAPWPKFVLGPLLATLMGAEIVGMLGLFLSPNLQQPARRAIAEMAQRWQSGAVLLLPQAEDTSGMTIDYAYEAPAGWPMILLRQDQDGTMLAPLLQGREAIFMVTLADGAGQRAIDAARHVLAMQGWHDVGSPGAHVSRLGQVWTEFLHGDRGIAQVGHHDPA